MPTDALSMVAGTATPEDPPTIHLDMDAIYRQAHTRPWRVEFDCDGVPYVWHGKAASSAAAELMARRELSEVAAHFSRFGARLVAAQEV